MIDAASEEAEPVLTIFSEDDGDAAPVGDAAAATRKKRADKKKLQARKKRRPTLAEEGPAAELL
jgi:hypothetical protein